MHKENFSIWANLKSDVPAALVVSLVALPLCLGIALASGAPLVSGLIAGIVGGVVVGSLSKSPLSVSGPAAGLTVIVLQGIEKMPSYEAFLLAVCLAGVFQIIFGMCRAGVVGEFIPSSVIKGMLAAIGIILILKQVPHAIGYDADYEGDASFHELTGGNTFTTLFGLGHHILPGAMIISLCALIFLAYWDKKQPSFKGMLRYIPGPLVVVLFGVVINKLFGSYTPRLALEDVHIVSVPVIHTLEEGIKSFHFPDMGMISNPAVWTLAITLALVASIESLLSIEAVDKLDPYKRATPTNRELFAQGVGNIVSGALGGLPVTSVIVRSSANVAGGARTKMSAIIHGVLLLLSVLTIPVFLNQIPLAALAAILISIGYKLTKPAIYRKKFQNGVSYFVPFVATILAIILTDLLIGIGVGIGVGTVFVLLQNFRSAMTYVKDGDHHLVRLKKDFFFLHKYELKRTLGSIPDNSKLLMDVSRCSFIDRDNIELINDFITNASYRNISVTLKTNPDSRITRHFNEV